MADDRRIVIEILNGDVSGDSSSSKNSSSDNTYGNFASALSKVLHPINTLESNTVGKNVIVNQAYQQAKQTIISTVESYHTRYFSLKEDYLSETTYNNARTAISKVTGAAGKIAGGAIMGAKLGPWGAAIGAGVGAVSFGVDEFKNKISTVSSYSQQLNAIDIQTAFSRKRAGLENDSKGTEN